MMNKISPLARATLQALHVTGASKVRIREVYEKAREEEIKRVQHCMAPDEREFINDLVRRQHEFDDEALDLAFEEIRGDVLCREAAAEAKSEKRDVLKKAQEDARKAADDAKLAHGSDARKKLRFEFIAGACAPCEEERDWLVENVTKMRKRNDPESEVEDYIRERVKKLLEPALAATGQMCDIPVDIPKKPKPPPPSGKPASKLKGGFFGKPSSKSKLGDAPRPPKPPPAAAKAPQIKSDIKQACRTESQFKMAEEVQRMRDAGVPHDAPRPRERAEPPRLRQERHAPRPQRLREPLRGLSARRGPLRAALPQRRPAPPPRARDVRGGDEDHRRPRGVPAPRGVGAAEERAAGAAAAPRRLRRGGPAHGQGQGAPRGLRPGERPAVEAVELRPLPVVHPRQAARQHGEEERRPREEVTLSRFPGRPAVALRRDFGQARSPRRQSTKRQNDYGELHQYFHGCR